MHHNPSSHYYKEFKDLRPNFLDRLDELPDEMNPTKVQPFLEYRTTVSGTYHFYPKEDIGDMYWNPMLNSRMYNIDVLKAEDDRNWNYYIKRNGYSPADYMRSDTYELRYGGKCDDPSSYVYALNSYFRRNFKGQALGWEGRDTCWFHDSDTPGMRARKSDFEMNRDESYPYKDLQGTYKRNSPCPLCRDWSLQLNYRNVDLLKQFIDPNSGQQLPHWKTHLCKFKQGWVSQAIEASRMLGYLEYPSTDANFSEWHLPDYELTAASGNYGGRNNKKVVNEGEVNFSELGRVRPGEGVKVDYRIRV